MVPLGSVRCVRIRSIYEIVARPAQNPHSAIWFRLGSAWFRLGSRTYVGIPSPQNRGLANAKPCFASWFRWSCHGSAMVPPWFCHGSAMFRHVPPWFRHGFAMVPPWFRFVHEFCTFGGWRRLRGSASGVLQPRCRRLCRALSTSNSRRHARLADSSSLAPSHLSRCEPENTKWEEGCLVTH